MPRRGDEPGRLSCAGETCPRRKGGSLDAFVSHGSGRTPSSPARPGMTLDEPQLLSRHEDGAELAMALWRFGSPLLALSSAPYGGGWGERHWILARPGRGVRRSPLPVRLPAGQGRSPDGSRRQPPGGDAVITLVLGGARSGKSEVAERIAAHLAGPITYLATLVPGGDPDLAARIEAHRARRPAGWRTVEAGAELPAVLRSVPGPVLVDALGPWVAASPGMTVDAGALCAALTGRAADTVVVSEEVGLGVHPATEDGRRFRDALGTLNQAVAAVADEVLFVVAGRILPLGPPGVR